MDRQRYRFRRLMIAHLTTSKVSFVDESAAGTFPEMCITKLVNQLYTRRHFNTKKSVAEIPVRSSL